MSSSKHPFRVTIIGAGIIGLTTACTLLKEYSSSDNLQLTIVSETFSPNTTGDVSAGYWEPYGLENIDERTLRWAGYTYDIFMEEFFSTKADRAGIIKIPSYTLRKYRDTNKFSTKPAFSSLVRHSRMLDEHEMKMFAHLQPNSGFAMSSVVVEVSKYLPQLQRYLAQDARVKFIQRKIQSLVEFKDKADVLIHCSGLAARHLANDESVRPARGQVIRVHAPWIKGMFSFYTDELVGYIIPQSDSVVLGGTFQLNDWNQAVNDDDTRTILRNCSKILPALEQIHHGKVQVGQRPYRDGGVRLEHEKTTDGMDIVHCYGHSGSGVTLSWGCAKDVVNIVKTLFPLTRRSDETATSHLPEHEQLWRLVPNPRYIVLQAKL